MKIPANYIIGFVLLAASIGLGISTLKLQSIYVQEQERNLHSLRERKAGIENYAHTVFRQLTSEKIEAGIKHLAEISEDPFLEDSEHFWIQNQSLKIPRVIDSLKSKSSNGQAYYEQLQELLTQVPQATHLQSDEKLLIALQTSINSKEASAVELVMRQLLTAINESHRDNPDQLAFLILLIDIFSHYEKASPVLIEHLLRDDLTDTNGSYIQSAQKQLLEIRPLLSKKDFDFFRSKVEALSIRNNVSLENFRLILNLSITLPNMENLATNTPLLIDDGWLVETDPNSIFGVKADLQEFLQSITTDMLQLQLINTKDTLAFVPVDSSVTAIDQMNIQWTSPSWEQALADLNQFNAIKNTMLITSFGILISIVAILWWFYRSQVRWANIKSEFVATVSHELRTPLSSIRLMAERLADLIGSEPKAKDYPQRIIKDIDSLSFLADNILSFERLNTGNWVTHKSPVALTDIVINLREELPLFVNKPVVIEHAGSSDIHLNSDPVLMKLLFLNLGKNSCHYNLQPEAHISVYWEEINDTLCVTFKDNGIGFNSNELENCFEPFYRGAAQKHTRGSGLGLALCRKIVGLHDGAISIGHTNQQGTQMNLIFQR